jgi:PLP dependent protein
MAPELIVRNLDRVRAEIAAAAQVAGRDPAGVKLVAVTKTVPVDAIRVAYDAGQRRFGENRVQELLAKRPLLPPDAEWHLIGHLQCNKAKPALEASDLIESVDSAKLLARLDELAGQLGKRQAILLQVNVSGEATKFGADADALLALADQALACRHLDCRGLMTIAPYGAGEDELRRIFGQLATLRDRVRERRGVDLPELSMGMSGDFQIAIACGATMVRIGTAIFGARA